MLNQGARHLGDTDCIACTGNLDVQGRSHVTPNVGGEACATALAREAQDEPLRFAGQCRRVSPRPTG
jgi:hypothetical protein